MLVLRLVWSALENKGLARVAHLQLQGDATPSAQNISHLSVRLEAGRAFLDTLVSVSTQDYFLISLAEWTYLPRIVMEISKLSTHDGSHPPAWNVAGSTRSSSTRFLPRFVVLSYAELDNV